MSSRPSTSKTTTIRTSATKTLSSGGLVRLGRVECQPADAMRRLSHVGSPFLPVDRPDAARPRGRTVEAGGTPGAAPVSRVADQFLARKSPMLAGVTSWNGM